MEFRHRRFRYWALLFAAAAVMLCGVSIYGTDDSSAQPVTDDFSGPINGQNVTVNACDGNGVEIDIDQGTFNFEPGLNITIGDWTFSSSSSDIGNLKVTINPLDSSGIGTTTLEFSSVADAKLDFTVGIYDDYVMCNTSDEELSYILEVRTTNTSNPDDRSILFRDGEFYHNIGFFPVYVGGFDESNKIEYASGDYSWYSMEDGIPYIREGTVSLKPGQTIGVNGHVITASSTNASNLNVPCGESSEISIGADISFSIDGQSVSMANGTVNMPRDAFADISVPSNSSVTVNGDTLTAMGTALNAVLNPGIEALVIQSATSVRIGAGSKAVVSDGPSGFLAIRNLDSSQLLDLTVNSSMQCRQQGTLPSRHFEVLAYGTDSFDKVQEVTVENSVTSYEILITSGSTSVIYVADGGVSAILSVGQDFGGSNKMNAVPDRGSPTVWTDGSENKLLSGAVTVVGPITIGSDDVIPGINPGRNDDVFHYDPEGGVLTVTFSGSSSLSTDVNGNFPRGIGLSTVQSGSSVQIDSMGRFSLLNGTVTVANGTSVNLNIGSDLYRDITASISTVTLVRVDAAGQPTRYEMTTTGTILVALSEFNVGTYKSYSGLITVTLTPTSMYVSSGTLILEEGKRMYHDGSDIEAAEDSTFAINPGAGAPEHFLEFRNGKVHFNQARDFSVLTYYASAANRYIALNGQFDLEVGSEGYIVTIDYGQEFRKSGADPSVSYSYTNTGDPSIGLMFLGDDAAQIVSMVNTSAMTVDGDLIVGGTTYRGQFDITCETADPDPARYLLFVDHGGGFTAGSSISVSVPDDEWHSARFYVVDDETIDFLSGSATFGAYTNIISVGGSGTIYEESGVSITGGKLILDSGSMRLPSGGRVTVGDVTVSCTAGPGDVLVATGTPKNTAEARDCELTFETDDVDAFGFRIGALPSTFSFSGIDDVSPGNDQITILEGSSYTHLSTTYAAVEDSEVILSENGLELLSGKLSFSGSLTVNGMVLSGTLTVGFSSGNPVAVTLGSSGDLTLGGAVYSSQSNATMEVAVGVVNFVEGQVSITSGTGGQIELRIAGTDAVLPSGTELSTTDTGFQLDLPTPSFTIGSASYEIVLGADAAQYTFITLRLADGAVRIPGDIASASSYVLTVVNEGSIVFLLDDEFPVTIAAGSTTEIAVERVETAYHVVLNSGSAGIQGGRLYLNNILYLESVSPFSVSRTGGTEVTVGAGVTISTPVDSYLSPAVDTFGVSENGYFDITYQIAEGESKVVRGTTLTAVGGPAIVESVDTDILLLSGSVSYASGFSVCLGAVRVNAVSGVAGGTVVLSSDSTFTVSAGQSVHLSNGSIPGERDFVSADASSAMFAEDLSLTLQSGSISLNDGESVTIGGVVFTATSAAVLSFTGGVTELVSGSVTAGGDYTLLCGENSISAHSNTSVTKSSDSAIVEIVGAPYDFTYGGKTVSFSGLPESASVTITAECNPDCILLPSAVSGTAGYSVSIDTGACVGFVDRATVTATAATALSVDGSGVTLTSGSVTLSAGDLLRLSDTVSVTAGILYSIGVSVGTTSYTVTLSAGASARTDMDQYTASEEETITLGSDGYFSKTYTVLSDQSVTINGDVYTAVDGDAELVLGGGYVTLTSGSVGFGPGCQVQVGTVRVENISDTPVSVTVSSAGTVSVSAGTTVVLSTSEQNSRRIVSGYSAVMGFDGTLALTLVSGTVRLMAQTADTIGEIMVGTANISTADQAVITKEDTGIALTQGTVATDAAATFIIGTKLLSVPAQSTVTLMDSAASLVLSQFDTFVYDGTGFTLSTSETVPAAFSMTVSISGTHVSLPFPDASVPAYSVTAEAGADLGFRTSSSETVRLVTLGTSSFSISTSAVTMTGTGGSITLSAGCEMWINADVRISGNSELILAYTPDGKTVTVPAGSVVETAGTSAIDSFATTAETVLGLNDNGYFDGTFTIVPGTPATISGMTYSAVGGNATVTLSSRVLTLTSGTVEFGPNCYITVGSVRISNDSQTASVSVSSAGTVSVVSGAQVGFDAAGYGTKSLSARHSAMIGFDATLALTLESGTVELDVQALREIAAGTVVFTTADVAVISKDDNGVTLASGNVTVSGIVSVIVGGRNLGLPAAATVDTDGTQITLTLDGNYAFSYGGITYAMTVSGGTVTAVKPVVNISGTHVSLPMTVAGITSYDVSVGTGADLGFYHPTAETVRLTVIESATFAVGSDKAVMKGTSGKIDVAAGCPVWINDTVYLQCSDSSFGIEYASSGKSVTIPADKTLSTHSSAGILDSYFADTETTLTVGEDGYFSKTFTIVPGTTSVINGMGIDAVGGNATVALGSGALTLTSGTVAYGAGTVLEVGGISVESVGTSGIITVSSSSTVVLNQGQTVRFTGSADEHDFTATSDCTISFSNYPAITIVSGQYSLAVGESIIIDGITVENTTSAAAGGPILVSADKTITLYGVQEVALHAGTLDRTYAANGQSCTLGFDNSLALTLIGGTAVLAAGTDPVTVGGISYRAGSHGDAALTMTADGNTVLVSGSVVSDTDYQLHLDNPDASVSASASAEVGTDNGSILFCLYSDSVTLIIGGLQYTYVSDGNVVMLTMDGADLDAQIDSGSTFVINGVGISYTVSAAVASATIPVQYQDGVPTINMADYVAVPLTMNVLASNKVNIVSAGSEYRMAVPAGTILSVGNGTIAIESTGDVIQTKIGTSTQSVTYGIGSGTGFTIAVDTSNDSVTVQEGMLSVGPGIAVGVENYMITSSGGTISVSSEKNIGFGAGCEVSVIRDNDSYHVKSAAAASSGLDELMSLLSQYTAFYNEIRGILVDNPFGIDNTVVLQKMDALMYDCSLSYDANKDLIDSIYDEYNSAGRDDNESRFEAYKSECISDLTFLHTAGECQEVSNFIDDCIDRIRNTHYSPALTYSSNLKVIEPFIKTSILGKIDTLSQNSFGKYKERVLADIETLHIGETCTNEKAMIDEAHAAVESYQYDPSMTFEANRAAVDGRLSDCEMLLKEYRNVEDSFQIYKTVKSLYVSTQDTFGSEDVVRLIGIYTEKIRALNYSGRISLDENLARVDAVAAEFDREVGQIGAKVFAADKNAVLGKAKALLTQYNEPAVRELINKAVFEIESYYYDSTVSYKSNSARIVDIYDTLELSIADHMHVLESKFYGYCQKYISVFNDRMSDPKYSDKAYQDMFTEAIASMGALAYDRNIGLLQNAARADDIAAALQKKILDESSSDNREAFEGYKADSVSYVARRVVSGATDAIEDLVDDYKRQITELEYDSGLTPEQNFEAVDNLRNEFDSKLLVLVARADFDRVIDVGVDYLEERYGANEGLAKRLGECIADLRATPYNESASLEDNQKVVETKVNNYSVELFDLRQKSDQGSFVNYREYLLWEIESKIVPNASDSLRAQAKEYTDRLKAVEYDPSSSYLWNKHVLQTIYDEYLDEAISGLVQFFKDDCRAQLRAMANGSSVVNSAISKAESAIRGYKQTDDLGTDLPAIRELFEYGRISVGYAISQSDEASFNAYVQERTEAIRTYPVSGDYLPVVRDNILASIREAMSSGMSLSDRSKAIEAFDRAFFEECRFITYRDSVADSIHRDHIFEDSAATAKIIDEYHSMIASMRFDEYAAAAEGIAVIDGIYSEYYGKLCERRLLDNSTVCGDLNPDGTSATTGEAAEYPEGSDEIWGIIGNIRGMGPNSTVVFKPAEVDADIFSKKQMPSETSAVSVLSDGKVLGAFDVTIYNNGDRVRNFSGVYVVKILLPSDMRGYESMQVAYVDEFGDVQVYEAIVEGNFLVFSTAHFSTFYVVAVNSAGHSYYDAYLYAAITVIVIVILVLVTRVTVYRDGTEGSKPAFTVSVGKHDSRLAQPFSREGYRLVGWKKAGSEELIPADQEMSQLGKYRILRLTAVWEEDSKGGKA